MDRGVLRAEFRKRLQLLAELLGGLLGQGRYRASPPVASDDERHGQNHYDRKGRDWDATITKIVDNPISIRQASWSPYKKFVRMIEEQIAKRAAAAEAASTDSA